MFCRNCGKQIPDGCAYCMECGTKVAGGQENAPQTANPVTTTPVVTQAKEKGAKPKKKKTGLIIGLILLLVLGLAAAGAIWFMNTDSQKFKKLMASAEELMDDEEYGDAAELLEEALEINEDDEDAVEMLIEAYEALAEEYEEDEKYNKADKLYDKIKDLEAEDDKKDNKDGMPASSAYDVSSGGEVLNIYCWNDEFQRRIEDHYPGYEVIDGVTGKIGDVKVKWNFTPSMDNAYQNNLDATLLKQKDAEDDDKIDIFLIEADFALKYVDSKYTVATKKLGIMDADIANQYPYTQNIVTDSNGVLKGLSWQACPGILYYNREVAKEVFGTDAPAEVQEYVKDWDTFVATAELMGDCGYQMVSCVNDTYRTYANNVTSPWVIDGKINIDANILKWVEDSKALVDYGVAGTHDLWVDAWSRGFYPEGKVFCYLGPSWLINYSMAADVEGSIGYNGEWGAVEGPQSSFWGGTWICAATGTDNADLIKDIMLKMTTDTEIMKGIATKDDDFVNDQPAMKAMAQSDYASKVMGGQNPLSIYYVAALKLDMSNTTAYDTICNEEFQKAMRYYFEGDATLDEAIDLFYKGVMEKCPELTK